jgi:flagellar L-ring protein precursor FlgH
MIRSIAGATLVLITCIHGHADSLFSRQVEERGTLVSDNKIRFEVGDVITVLVRENIDARTDAQLDTEKQSELNAEADPEDNSSFTGDDALIDLPEGLLPNYDVEAESRHESDGTTRRRNRITFSVSCHVTKVWANGNIQIEGEKRVTVNRDDSFIKLSGIARTRDVSAQNTVLSTSLANAVVEMKGKGPLWNSQRRGLFTRFMDWFAPY